MLQAGFQYLLNISYVQMVIVHGAQVYYKIVKDVPDVISQTIIFI